ncbi:MAG TPA: methionyl-tRNA formyltransferase, partial [Microbacteriaceae bacterium]|nr:methionyl-tRNA formyltransferase [Microbacteriaceae bacterium]
ERIKVLRAAPDQARVPSGTWVFEGGVLRWGTGDGSLRLLELQPAGRGAMPADAWWRGRRS